MPHTDREPTRTRRLLAGALIVLGVMAVIFLPAAVVSATPSGSPSPSPTPSAAQLSIAVDNGRTSAVVGDRLSYTITVRNLGNAPVRGLRVSQTVPAGLRFESAGAHGVAKAGTVSWTLDLKATGSTTLHTVGTVTTTPAELLRLATVACARLSDKGPPLVCASHSDQLPAGVAAEAALTGNEQPTWSPKAWQVALAAVVVLAGAVAALLIVRRRRRATPA